MTKNIETISIENLISVTGAGQYSDALETVKRFRAQANEAGAQARSEAFRATESNWFSTGKAVIAETFGNLVGAIATIPGAVHGMFRGASAYDAAYSKELEK